MLCASRPKIVNAIVFSPYVLRSLQFSPQNHVQFFSLLFVLRALRFLSQNYEHIRIYPVRATFSCPKNMYFFFSLTCYVLYASRPKIVNAFLCSPVRTTYCTLLAFMYLTPWCCCMKTTEALTDFLGSPLSYDFLRPVYTRFSVLCPPTRALCKPVMTLPVITIFAIG